MATRLYRTGGYAALAALLLSSTALQAAAPAAPMAVMVQAATDVAPVAETPKEAKARIAAEKKAQKAAEKEAKRLAKEEEKQRKAAERAARPKKKSNGLANCAGGAVVGVLGALLLGGKKKSTGEILAGAAIGCAVGYGLGEILSKRDQEEMSDYVDNDYLLRDDVAESTFDARESGQTVALMKGEVTTEQVDHQVRTGPDVMLADNNILVNDRYMRVTTSLRLRSTPDSSSNDNIVGGFEPNDIVRTFGSTLDGQWTYVAERQPDGVYEIVGYAATQYLSTNLNKPQRVAVTTTKPRPVAKPATKAAPKSGTTLAPAVRTAEVRTVRAPTACKSFTAAAGGKQGGGTGCSGARSLAFNSYVTTKGKRA